MSKTQTVQTPPVPMTAPDLDTPETPAQTPDAPEVAAEEPLTEAEAEKLYAEAVKLDDRIADLKERRDAIADTFRRRARPAEDGYGTLRIGHGQVIIGHNPIFNEARFLTEFPYDKEEEVDEVVRDESGRKRIKTHITYPNRDFYKIAVDRPAAKRILGDDAYGAFMDEGTKKVTIK